MLYLVTTDHFLQGSPREPEQNKLLFEQVITSVEILHKLKEEGKILAGGVPSAQRKHVFIIEAELFFRAFNGNIFHALLLSVSFFKTF